MKSTPLICHSAARLLALAALALSFLEPSTSCAQTNCAPSPSGLVAWWPGDGFALDVASTNHGTLQNGATFTNGFAGRAFHFDGVNDSVSIPEATSTDLSRMTNWTIEAWVRPLSFANQSRPTIYSEGGFGISLGVNNGTGQPESWVNNANRFIGTNALLLAQWNHIALISDGSTRIFYVNGSLAGQTNMPTATPDNNGAVIGAVTPSATGSYFSGQIDEVSIYNRALAADEIAAIHAAGSAGKCYTNDPTPVFVQQPTNQTAGLLGSVSIGGAAMGTPRPGYQWLFNNTPLAGATNVWLSLSNLAVTNGGNYSLVASNTSGVVTSSVALLTVQPFVLFDSDRTIAANNTNYEGGDIVIGSATVTIDGFHTFNSLLLTNGANLTHSPALTNGFWLTISNSVFVSANSSIYADGRGHGSDTGPGSGVGAFNGSGGGGGYGGNGGSGTTSGGLAYGSEIAPSDLGSGGGYCILNGTPGSIAYGGAGGGRIRLEIGGSLTVQGTLRANGNDGDSISTVFSLIGAGGGAGGSIHVSANSLEGNGAIFANGGLAGAGRGGGGGGGRVALYYTNFSYNGAISVNGGSGYQEGEPGTVYTTPRVLPNPKSFESGWDGWWQDGSLWTIRPPGNGPGTAFAGTNAACGNTGGNYAASSHSRLISPRFIVPSVSGDDRVILRFWQWYQYGTGDSGVVQISTLYGTDWTTLAVTATNGTSGTWALATVDLTQFEGQEVHVAFYHKANSDGSVGAGWFIDDVSLSQATPTRLGLNAPSAQQFTTNGQSQYFVVSAPPGGHLRLTLNDLDNLGINELYVRRGSLPTAGSYDYRFNVSGGADQYIFIPNAGAGDWFVLAYNDSGPVPGGYTLQAGFTIGGILDSLSPAKVGNSVASSVTINGAGFTPSDLVTLVNGGTVYPATDVFTVSASQIIANFNFPAIPTNVYQLTVTSTTNSVSLPFELIAGVGAKLETHLTVPGRVGRHAPATIYIQYANTGDTPMPAPLLVLTSDQRPILRPILANLAVNYAQGFWTSAEPIGWSPAVQFLANGATPGLLQPGESNTISIAYAGLVQPWDSSTVRFDLGVVTVTNTTQVDWNSFKSTLKPVSIPPDAWDALWASFLTQAGTTWGGYVQMLDHNAAYLRTLGLDVKDLDSLLAFSFAQADGLNVIRTLASSTDAYVPTPPGLRLSLERFFPQSISGRFRNNAIGRGWAHNWEISLAQASDGTVTVTGPGGSRRIF